jgi:hypothetical protein
MLRCDQEHGRVVNNLILRCIDDCCGFGVSRIAR